VRTSILVAGSATLFRSIVKAVSNSFRFSAEIPKSNVDAVHKVRVVKTIRPIVGPAILPRSEAHHESRQTSGAYLRARMFESVSKTAPRMSRRDRRRYAKQFARNEYRRMMNDGANTGEASCN
jgi:hypothetical protein